MKSHEKLEGGQAGNDCLPAVGKEIMTNEYLRICLLSIVGKMYEYLTRNRLGKELKDNGVISDTQFGIRKKDPRYRLSSRLRKGVRRSPNDWCELITLDVKNTFNNAAWNMNSRRARVSAYSVQVEKDDLRDKKLIVDEEAINKMWLSQTIDNIIAEKTVWT